MPKIAVIGGTGYLASLIKNQNKLKNNKFFYLSRKKKSKNYINFSNIEKNKDFFKKFDFIVHLLGPNKSQIEKKIGLIKKKNEITSKICDICINYNIKLIYISSMQVYKNYGKAKINVNSAINLTDSYARSHYEAEKIILKKFRNKDHMFTILRLGNVFGFNKNFNINELSNNLIHDFCKSALKRQKIIVENGKIQRQFIPSHIFVNIINKTINNKILNNSILNVGYKVFNLKEISLLIKKRFQKIYNKNISLIIKNYEQIRKKTIYINKHYYLNFDIKKIYLEIDQVLRNMKRNLF